jgi:hypothetical protein
LPFIAVRRTVTRMSIDSIDGGGKRAKKRGMGDPKEADAEEDRDNDLAAGRAPRDEQIAELSRKDEPDPVAGTSAVNYGGPRGGSHKCGNPIGYGTCGGEIDDDDPNGRCTKCGVPTRAAMYENMAIVKTDYAQGAWPSEQKIVSLDGTMTLQGLALAREAARLTLQRHIGAQFWQEHQIDPESQEFADRTKGDPKLRRLIKELDGLTHEAFKRAGLLPHPGSL